LSERSSPIHILTAEYPPRVGGVSDHTFQIAAGLAEAGDEVHVWCGRDEGVPLPTPPGVTAHRLAGSFRPSDLRRMAAELDRFPPPRRLLVQWVPHSYGLRSMNLPLCLWLLSRSRAGDRIEPLVHEPGVPFSLRNPRWNIPAFAHRLMAVALLRAASHVWVSAPEWAERWKPLRLGRGVHFEWLPLPNGLPVVRDEAAVRRLRRQLVPDGNPLVGNFGMVPGGVAEILTDWALPLLAEPAGPTLLLIGKGSETRRAQLLEGSPASGDRIRATGVISAETASLYLQACDLMLQPYAGGVNARRSSLVVAIAHGLPVVTTRGRFTEGFWAASGGVELVPDDDPDAAVLRIRRLVGDAGARRRLGQRALRLYDDRFDLRHAISALRRQPPLDRRDPTPYLEVLQRDQGSADVEADAGARRTPRPVSE
jgi:glycosyltransferase involved in cell wall biosynthesis